MEVTMEEVIKTDKYQLMTNELRAALAHARLSRIYLLSLELYRTKGYSQIGYKGWAKFCTDELWDVTFPSAKSVLLEPLLRKLVDAGMTHYAVSRLFHLDNRTVKQMYFSDYTRKRGVVDGLAGRSLADVERHLQRFIFQVSKADAGYRETAISYWAEHLTGIEQLLSEAWNAVTGVTPADLDRALEEIRKGTS
jgi:hypothetical protein